jgi:hypothetical protein
MNGSAGYITVTTGLPDPAQLSAHPYIYTRFACAHTDARPRENFVFLKTILDQVQTLHAVAKGEYRATFGADEILARDKPAPYLSGPLLAIESCTRKTEPFPGELSTSIVPP